MDSKNKGASNNTQNPNEQRDQEHKGSGTGTKNS